MVEFEVKRKQHDILQSGVGVLFCANCCAIYEPENARTDDSLLLHELAELNKMIGLCCKKPSLLWAWKIFSVGSHEKAEARVE